MRRFFVEIPVAEGVTDIDGVELDLTADDAEDLNAGLSITSITTQGEEIEVFPG